MKREIDAAKGDKEKTAAVKARYEAEAKKKENAIRAAIKKHLTGEDLVIRDYIRDDFIENFDRIYEAAYKTDNILMTKVLSYLPIYGKGAGHEAEISVNGMKVTVTPEKGFEIDRKNIPEYAVTDIETDFFKLFYRGVENQEHFAAFAPFIKGMNAVFHGKDTESSELRDKLGRCTASGLWQL